MLRPELYRFSAQGVTKAIQLRFDIAPLLEWAERDESEGAKMLAGRQRARFPYCVPAEISSMTQTAAPRAQSSKVCAVSTISQSSAPPKACWAKVSRMQSA